MNPTEEVDSRGGPNRMEVFAFDDQRHHEVLESKAWKSETTEGDTRYTDRRAWDLAPALRCLAVRRIGQEEHGYFWHRA